MADTNQGYMQCLVFDRNQQSCTFYRVEGISHHLSDYADQDKAQDYVDIVYQFFLCRTLLQTLTFLHRFPEGMHRAGS